MSAVTLTTVTGTWRFAWEESAEAVVPAGVSTPTHRKGVRAGKGLPEA